MLPNKIEYRVETTGLNKKLARAQRIPLPVRHRASTATLAGDRRRQDLHVDHGGDPVTVLNQS
jgi:hypothetical protein